MMDGTIYDADYYERGIESGKSLYQNYRWMPEATMSMAMALIDYLVIRRGDSVLDLGCFIAGTKILMSNFKNKNIEDVKKGDTVVTHRNRLKKVISVMEREAPEILKIKSLYGVELFTTKEHPLLVQDSLECSVYGTHSLEFYKNSYYRCIKCSQKVRFSPYFKEAKDLKKGDFLCVPRLRPARYSFKNEDLAEFLGFYLAEGHIMYSHKPHFGGVGFTFHYDEVEYAERVKQLGLKLGATSVTIKPRKNKTTREVHVFGKKLADKIYSLGGRYSHHKTINKTVLRTWDDGSIIKVIKSWLKGDGTWFKALKKGQAWQGSTVSYQLAQDLKLLSHKLGISPAFTIKTPLNKPTVYILTFCGTDLNILEEGLVKYKTKKRYLVDAKYIYVPIVDMEKIQKKTKVFNFEVADDNSYIANNVCVHNCAKGFLVKAFQLLQRQACGIDVSKYAIDNVDPAVELDCRLIHKPADLVIAKTIFDFCIAKDVFEHIDEDEISTYLHYLPAERLFVCVPLGDANGFRATPNNLDVTHVTCKPEQWWHQKFEDSGWRVYNFSFRVDGIKESYYEKYPEGHGFFVLLKK